MIFISASVARDSSFELLVTAILELSGIDSKAWRGVKPIRAECYRTLGQIAAEPPNALTLSPRAPIGYHPSAPGQ
jgi:hypothetical protein